MRRLTLMLCMAATGLGLGGSGVTNQLHSELNYGGRLERDALRKTGEAGGVRYLAKSNLSSFEVPTNLLTPNNDYAVELWTFADTGNAVHVTAELSTAEQFASHSTPDR